jgi:hypothetical protein
VLFEMLAGACAFPGDTLRDVLAAVVHTDPAWDDLPETLPSGVRRLLRRCLAKHPDERLHDIADARLEIYMSNRSGVPALALYRRPLAGDGDAVRIGEPGHGQYSESLSKDGKTIVAMEMNPSSGSDLYLVPYAGGSPPVPLLVTGSSEYAADLSRDGKRFVYVSRASGWTEDTGRTHGVGMNFNFCRCDGRLDRGI